MPVRNAREIPKVESRHKWAFNMRAGVDIESVLGIPAQASQLAELGTVAGLGGSTGSGVLSKLVDVGTIESVDLGNKREMTQRYGFNSNPLEPFQVAPHGASFSLLISRVVLKKLPEVESAFQFLPSNLLLQQLPFVIEMLDVGDGDPSTFIRHLIYGCWFSDSKSRYDATSRDDTKLIQQATVIPGRVITYDPSFGGSPTVQAASAIGGLLFQALQSNTAASNLLEDFDLN